MIEHLKIIIKNTLFCKNNELNKLLFSYDPCLIAVNRLDSQIKLLQTLLSYIDYLEKNYKDDNKNGFN